MLSKILNAAARRRYQYFSAALVSVDCALEEAARVVARVDDGLAPSGVFTLPTHDELQRILNQAGEALRRMHNQARTYESELVSREWRPTW